MKPGDILILYRKGTTPGRKVFESVVTTIGVIDEIKYDFTSKEEFLKHCENRTVFSYSELERFWNNNRAKLLVIKFVFVKNLNKRLNLNYLWKMGIVDINCGPRPFDEISDDDFNAIIKDSETELFLK